MATRGHSDNSLWFSFRKGIAASKFLEVMTKMKKVFIGGGGIFQGFY